MTDIEQKALALLNEVQGSTFTSLTRDSSAIEALCRAIEQHEAFRQEVSDVAEEVVQRQGKLQALLPFIIPAPKPDPLVEAYLDVFPGDQSAQKHTDRLRWALDALGFEIRGKGQ